MKMMHQDCTNRKTTGWESVPVDNYYAPRVPVNLKQSLVVMNYLNIVKLNISGEIIHARKKIAILLHTRVQDRVEKDFLRKRRLQNSDPM